MEAKQQQQQQQKKKKGDKAAAVQADNKKEKEEEDKQDAEDDMENDTQAGQNGAGDAQNKKKKKKNKKKKAQGTIDPDMAFLDELEREREKENKLQQKKTPNDVQQGHPQPEEHKEEPALAQKGPVYREGACLDFKLEQDNSFLRNLGSWKEKDIPWKQTDVPTILIDAQFPDRKYPEGLIMQYTKDNAYRTSSAEMKLKDLLLDDDIKNLRKAAECHRQVRRWCQRIIRPGRKLIEVCEEIEELNRYLVGENGLKAGIAFPTGCSLNHVAAHYTPNPGDQTTIGYDDVCKIDFGTQVEGRIIDSAFTVAFNPKFDKLLECVKDATYTGIREAGIDVRLGDIGAAIQEVMESYEIELGGKTFPIKCVRNLNGHSIEPYHIHAGKSVPIVKTGSQVKMEEGEQYAIETFGSTGKGYVNEDLECSHFMKDFDARKVALKNPKSRSLLKFIDNTFSTLAFCRRWLDRAGQTGHILALKDLVNHNIINPCPPLCDVSGSYVAQYEHTFLLKPSGKEILSQGDDY